MGFTEPNLLEEWATSTPCAMTTRRRLSASASKRRVEERRDGGAVRVVVEVRVRSTAHDAAAPLARIPHFSE